MQCDISYTSAISSNRQGSPSYSVHAIDVHAIESHIADKHVLPEYPKCNQMLYRIGDHNDACVPLPYLSLLSPVLNPEPEKCPEHDSSAVTITDDALKLRQRKNSVNQESDRATEFGDHVSISAFDTIRKFKTNHPRNLIITHYNVNSIRHKFYELNQLLHREYVDVFAVAETKLDLSFNDGQFYIENYKLYRQDRNAKGGGILVYIKNDIPHRVLKDFSGVYEGIDYLTFECITKSRKWYVSYLYRPPNI